MGEHTESKDQSQRFPSRRKDAPAKLNLFLELLGKRPDGFHELETVMVAISRFDSLEVSPNTDGSISLCLDIAFDDRTSQESNRRNEQPPEWTSVSQDRQSESESNVANDLHAKRVSDSDTNSRSPEIPAGSDNIVVRAVERLRSAANITVGADIRLIKRIPTQAGMGGASSDAAVAMMLANEAWDLRWTNSQLANLAETLGSDIPFFFGSGAAVCRGRGEIIEPIENRIGKIHFVVVKPRVSLATPAVFRKCSISSHPESAEPMIAALRNGDLNEVARGLHNRLRPAADCLTDEIKALAARFDQTNCLGHGMSGSGSSYFGIYHHQDEAREAADQLRQFDLGLVFAAHSIETA